MTALTFSTSNIIALHQLELQIRRETGVKHNLSNEASLLDLVRLASASTNRAVANAFKNFEIGLDESVKKQLIYRGVISSREHSQALAKSQDTTKPKIYRGNIISESSISNAENTGVDSETAMAEMQRKKRVYRGRVID
ncbi:hypothetical protein MAH1_11270 [Sessilibacter sp. MAH1]